MMDKESKARRSASKVSGQGEAMLGGLAVVPGKMVRVSKGKSPTRKTLV